ncbi:MAG: acyl-CoA dehydrogenase family protein [Dehalococcoidia bacterium]|nr:acyl-CoA dehydrogenase family protein [Dehalococcoidia bacterium]
MRIRFTAEQQAFREEVRSFVSQNLSDGAEFSDELRGEMGWSPAFSRKLAERGWIALAWPREYGGAGLGFMEQVIFNEEMSYAQAPIGAHRRGVFYVGPILILYGTEEQRRVHLRAITEGMGYYCQGFSEPGAGSDLASLTTRAVRDGDDYLVSGQKIWTADAHRSDYCWLAARTDPAAPKHKGISNFILDMHAPGVTVRPLVNMAGGHSFNEVFFDNVRVPAVNLVGEENRGWYQTAATLDFERSSIAVFAGTKRFLDDFAVVLRGRPRRQRDVFAVADLYTGVLVGQLLSYFIASVQEGGGVPNREASAAKLLSSELRQRASATALEALGPAGAVQAGPGALAGGLYVREYLAGVSATIAGGTSEIQRGVIATRGLGLPRG